MKRVTLIAVGICLLASPAAIALDQNLPAYKPVSGVSGQFKSVGSDTLGNSMELWAKGFRELYPDAKITIEDKGSATAPPALLEGSAQFGPMSRPWTSDESEAFEKKFGYKASYVAVAVDALAVYVNKENPIRCLSVQQVDQIFSSTSQGQRRQKHPHLGRCRSGWRLGRQNHRAVWSQRHFGDARIFQGDRSLWWRF